MSQHPDIGGLTWFCHFLMFEFLPFPCHSVRLLCVHWPQPRHGSHMESPRFQENASRAGLASGYRRPRLEVKGREGPPAWGTSQRVPGMKEGCRRGKKDEAQGRGMKKDEAEGRRMKKDAAHGRRTEKGAAQGRRGMLLLLFQGKAAPRAGGARCAVLGSACRWRCSTGARAMLQTRRPKNRPEHSTGVC